MSENFDRRDLFRIVGAAGIAASPILSPAATYSPRALTPARFAALGQMLEILLPADAVSPSARDAGVDQYLDTTLLHADERTRQAWAAGIDAISGELKDGDPIAALTRIAANELSPRTEAERFFVLFKQSAISAYYLSEGGRKSLGYHGDTAVHHVEGCTHAAHKS